MNRSDELVAHTGLRGVLKRGLRRYRRAFLRAAADSEALHRLFLSVVNLEHAPSALLRPWVVTAVARSALRRTLGWESGESTSPRRLATIPDTRLSGARDTPLLSAQSD